jgi:peptidoglycan hydrolase-like protein with peptidoglycan-binding domain
MRAQKELKRLGFYNGPADGALGPATRDAIIRFEVKNQLTVDPRVSDRLLSALTEQAPGSPNAPPTAAATPSPPTREDAPPSAPPPTGSPQVATGANPPLPEATGRQALPNWVNPPAIR